MSVSRGTQGRELFALLGERWNYAILREIFYGVSRFGPLQRALGIAPNMLTSRLSRLVELGLVDKVPYRDDKPWCDYSLSESARAIVPAWMVLAQWAEANLPDGDRAERAIRHTACGQTTHPVLNCDVCGKPMEAREITPAEPEV